MGQMKGGRAAIGEAVREACRSLPVDMVLPGRVMEGPGCLDALPEVGRGFGRRGFILYGRGLLAAGKVASLSRRDEVLLWRYDGGEPEVDGVEALLSVARSHGADWVAGIGGGSVLDAAKVVAGLFHAGASVADYHRGVSIEGGGLPFLAVPTTAGSGSEATMVAVLSDPSREVKRSIRHPHFVARAVFLDPLLLQSNPRTVVAHSGMDALAQAIEAYLSRHATVFTDAVALEAVRLIEGALLRLYTDRTDLEAAAAMLTGSYFAGLALSGARLGVVHGLAHPIGWQSRFPHGFVCAMCLPLALAFNRPAVPQRLAVLDALSGGSIDARVAELLAQLDIPRTSGHPLPQCENDMVAEVLASGSTAANPRTVREADVREMLRVIYPG